MYTVQITDHFECYYVATTTIGSYSSYAEGNTNIADS